MRASSRILTASSLLFLAAVGGCSSPTEPFSGGVVVQNVARDLVVINRRSKPIYTTVVGRRMAASIDMAFGVGGPPSVWPGGVLRILSSEIFGDENETEALLFWWEAARGENGQLTAGEIHSVVVPLR